MTGRLDQLRAAASRPLPLACHPLYRFYQGSLALRVRAGPDGPVRVIRCLGPAA